MKSIYQAIYNRLNSYANLEVVTRQENYFIIQFLIETIDILDMQINNSKKANQKLEILGFQNNNAEQYEINFAERFNNFCKEYFLKEVGKNLVELKLMVMFNEHNQEISLKLQDIAKQLSNLTKREVLDRANLQI